MQEEIVCLQEVINKVIKRKACKRRFIRVEETLIVSKVSNIIAIIESSSRKEGKTLTKRVRRGRRYGRYSEIRHNSRTYIVEIDNLDNSVESK